MNFLLLLFSCAVCFGDDLEFSAGCINCEENQYFLSNTVSFKHPLGSISSENAHIKLSEISPSELYFSKDVKIELSDKESLSCENLSIFQEGHVICVGKPLLTYENIVNNQKISLKATWAKFEIQDDHHTLYFKGPVVTQIGENITCRSSEAIFVKDTKDHTIEFFNPDADQSNWPQLEMNNLVMKFQKGILKDDFYFENIDLVYSDADQALSYKTPEAFWNFESNILTSNEGFSLESETLGSLIHQGKTFLTLKAEDQGYEPSKLTAQGHTDWTIPNELFDRMTSNESLSFDFKKQILTCASTQDFTTFEGPLHSIHAHNITCDFYSAFKIHAQNDVFLAFGKQDQPKTDFLFGQRLDFNTLNHIMTLTSAPPKKVLYYCPSDQNQISAQQISLNTQEHTMHSKGRVKSFLKPEEQLFLEQHFKIQHNPTTQNESSSP